MRNKKGDLDSIEFRRKHKKNKNPFDNQISFILKGGYEHREFDVRVQTN